MAATLKIPATVSEMIDIITGPRVEARTDRSYKAIWKAKSENQCPASWYRVFREELLAKGYDCPFDLFGFINTAPLSDDFDAGHGATRKLVNSASDADSDAEADQGNSVSKAVRHA